jgi:hypothetical protein
MKHPRETAAAALFWCVALSLLAALLPQECPRVPGYDFGADTNGAVPAMTPLPGAHRTRPTWPLFTISPPTAGAASFPWPRDGYTLSVPAGISARDTSATLATGFSAWVGRCKVETYDASGTYRSFFVTIAPTPRPKGK